MREDLEQIWNMQYEQLAEFKRKNGHCMVPSCYEQNKSLTEWVSRQRSYHKNNKIRPDRKIILDEIGFAWKADRAHTMNQHDKLWHRQFEKLVEFKRTNGHCLVVPRRKCDQDKILGQWVKWQRSCHVNKKLQLDRKKLLDELDFVWKVEGPRNININDKKVWHQQYEKLVEFKRKMGHCLVPRKYEQDKSLGVWVNNQRRSHKSNKIRRDRKIILDEIGFAWKARPARYSTTTTTTTTSSVGLPNEALVEELEQAQGHVTNQSECPSPNRKRPSTCLAEGGQLGARTSQRGKATASSSYVEQDGGSRDEEDSKPSLLTNSAARAGSHSDQEVVQEQATTLREIPYGWTRVKLEPDC